MTVDACFEKFAVIFFFFFFLHMLQNPTTDSTVMLGEQLRCRSGHSSFGNPKFPEAQTFGPSHR